MSFLLKYNDREIVVSKCGDCPQNVAVKRGPLPWVPSHHCADTFDQLFKEGTLILNPNVIPVWCPHVAP